ncbi:cupin domain-containing protein [Marinomonas mediterranea]|jgi:gentisate 1,2-dioxygenase (EC 1.13.11.4)|uniref:Cupin 2 conserved barrel domain protein n=1 Tax=Marinomonas mediterranea (strain ATCC 700492 / JCM 21426 / NBRC 103028 / MMB-1) TaxID=717774 RepID=F2K4P2_MARM1|nr:cupin domain-containing protein [Marinomonas mediterranea]ADZ91435.1 Cupin 2 conserved barrel domain protein [Marinomonas mediterranea MMB-1]WCN09402.1 cupin domain-containing protein [Marinomonas mediterranea]WCN13479.1 cupin domain-containing protein [Marinomonas mediterranea]WCN17544.1 cupin domain-containing protein [Marinomonas mediterranea MMB-1]
MQSLGTLEDLPQSYRDKLTDLNLVPLWPNMRAVLPHKVPSRKTQTLNWQFDALRPLLIEAGDLTPMEKAERRVLVLANPGHGLTNMQATPSIYMGLQLILPGETAPNHRHTPNAVRIIIEGEGATTIVDGEPCIMERGDLILTPSGKWHEHQHEGDGPIIWLDILDLPLIYQLEGSWAIEGKTQTNVLERDKSFAEYSAAGVVPELGFKRENTNSPMLRYPWSRTRACLIEMAQHYSDRPIRIAYVNPENGASLFPSIGFGAMMLRPNESLALPKRTTACVFHIVEGQGTLQVDSNDALKWTEKDTLSAPGYSEVTLSNTSATEPAFIITADEAPLHRYLGIF